MGFRAISDTYTTQPGRVRTFADRQFISPFAYFLVFAALPVLFLLFFFFIIPSYQEIHLIPISRRSFCLLVSLMFWNPFSSLSPSWCPRVVGTCVKKGGWIDRRPILYCVVWTNDNCNSLLEYHRISPLSGR